MPPPSDKLQGIWTKTIAESSDLRDRWGGATEFPIDDKGNADIQAIRDLLSVGSGRKVSVAPQETRERPGTYLEGLKDIARYGLKVFNPSLSKDVTQDVSAQAPYPVAPPIPVDWGQWGQRGKDLAGLIGVNIDPTPELPEDAGLGARAFSKYVDPLMTGLGAIDKIVAPARGMAFGGWVPGLTKPGVQARSRALREQGFGPWASAGAAYEQAVEAGEIPWWQRYPVEAVTDPIELVPGVGIAGKGTQLGLKGVSALTKTAASKAAKEAPEAVLRRNLIKPRRVPIEEAAKLAEVRAIGPRSKIAILEGRHREALEAIRNLEDKIPQAQRQLDMPPTTPQLSTKTGALKDRVIRNEAEFFLETVDDQLDIARATEKNARIALMDAQGRARGRFAKEALAQRDVEIGRGILSPAAQVADIPTTPAVQAAGVPGAPTAARAAGEAVPGVERAARVADNFTSESADEFLASAFKEDPGSRLAEKLAGLPGFKAVMSRVFTPASIARLTGNEVIAEGYAYRGMQAAQEALASRNLGEFSTTTVSGMFGRPTRLFDVATEGLDRGKVLLGDGTRAAFGDVAQNPTAFLNRGQIDNAQHKWITDAHRYIDELARNYELVSGKKLISKWANVEHYWPRFVEKADGSTGIVREKIFSKQPPSAKRKYETMQDGMEAGIKYVPDPHRQLDFYSKAVSKMTRDAIFEKRLLTKQIKLPDGTTVEMATRRKFGEKIDPEKMPSWQSRRSWNDIDITDEAKRQLAQPMGVSGGAFLSTAEMVSAVPKFIMAGLFDTGMFMLQGMNFLFHRPVGWSKAVMGALETLFSRSPEDYYNHWIRTGYAEKIKDASAHGLDTAALSEWYQVGKTGLGGLGRIPVLGKPVEAVGQRFGAAFHAFINTGRIEMYDAMATVARKKISDPVELERELHRIGRIAESLMGGTSTKGLGLSASQRQLENAFIFFAPRYTRAVFATVAHAALGKGVGANETRKILAKMMFGTTLIVAGVIGALGVRAGKSREEIKNEILLALNPKSGAAFMSVNIAGNYYGLGGGYRALASVIANTAGVPGPEGKPNSWQYMMQSMERKGGLKEPKALVELALGNPFVSFWRTKSSVLSGTLADFIDGEDFVGEQFGIGAFVKDPTLFAAALRRRTTPFPVESFIEVLSSGSGLGTAVAAGGVEFLGGRYVEKSIGRRITTIEDQMVENTFGRGDHPDYPGVVYTKMLDLEKAAEKGKPTVTQKNIVERDPKNKALMEEKERLEGQYPASKTGVSKMYDEISKKQDERMDREGILVDTYVKRLVDPSDKKANDPYAFRVGLAKSSSKFTTSKDVIEQIYKAEEPGVAQWLSGREPDRLKEPQRWTIFKFFQIREESRDPLGDMDYDKFEKSWAEEQASWGEDSGLSELFENWQREYVGERNPIVQQYYDDQKVLSNVGYWQDDFPETTSRLQKSYRDLNVEGIWKSYLDADDTNRTIMEKSLDARVRNIIRILKNTRDNHRIGLRQSNQEVDRIRVKWYRQKPLHRQNMVLWNQLYVSQ